MTCMYLSVRLALSQTVICFVCLLKINVELNHDCNSIVICLEYLNEMSVHNE